MSGRFIAVPGLLLIAGCQVAPRAEGLYFAGGPAEYVCAADFGPEAAGPSATTAPSATQPTTQPGARAAYTAPGVQFQRMSLAAVAGATLGMADAVSAGKGREAAENASLSAVSIGRPSLAPAFEAATFEAVGRRGLLRGRAGLLGGSPANNLFTPRANPVSAHCNELVGAGFFSNSAACREHFRR